MIGVKWRKRWLSAALLLCFAAGAMVGCTHGNEDFRDVTVKRIPDSVDNEENADADVFSSYMEQPMVYGEQTIVLADWLNQNEMRATQYSVTDLDENGAAEVVLRLAQGSNEDMGFLILQEDGDTVYGHMLSHRQFGDLKQDGTFSFSGGVSNHGVGRIVFADGGYTVVKIAYCESSYPNMDEISYYIDGQSATKDGFDDYTGTQDQKPDAEWLPVAE